MKLLHILITATLLSACGKDDSSGGSNDSSGQKDEKRSSDVPNISTSYYVNSVDDLVACDNQRKGFLAFIKKTNEFKACVDEGWVTVDLKGKDGKDGKDGKNGTDGKDGSVVSPNVYYDAIAKKNWYIGGSGAFDANRCGSEYRYPTEQEARDLYQNGVIPGLQAKGITTIATGIYINKNNMESGWYYNNNTQSVSSSSSAAHYCIQK